MLDHAFANKMIQAATAKATDLGVRGSVAVMDGSGQLKAFSRMDGSLTGTIDAAMRKAYTAAVSGMSTAAWFGLYTNNQAFGSIVAHGTSGMLFLPGGEPLMGSSAPLGGIGFSGGSPDQDVEVVRAALAVAKTT